jgi:hypothetical protein
MKDALDVENETGYEKAYQQEPHDAEGSAKETTAFTLKSIWEALRPHLHGRLRAKDPCECVTKWSLGANPRCDTNF